MGNRQGYISRSVAKACRAKLICFRLLTQWMRRALALARPSAGNNRRNQAYAAAAPETGEITEIEVRTDGCNSAGHFDARIRSDENGPAPANAAGPTGAGPA